MGLLTSLFAREQEPPPQIPVFKPSGPARHLDLDNILSERQLGLYQDLANVVTDEDARKYLAAILEYHIQEFEGGTFPENSEDILLLTGYILDGIRDYILNHVLRDDPTKPGKVHIQVIR